jgi:hypothetical protein
MDFTLFSLNGDTLNLQSALMEGKPVVLIAGSYTCPVFRNKISVINDVAALYQGFLNIYIIYTLEAHPYPDTSVYFGYVNPTNANVNAGILYAEPLTYGERKAIASAMINDVNPAVPVYIDGPCNEWWSIYGPAPNNSYIIDTSGIIVSKHGWFHKFPDNIYCELDSITGINSGKCTAPGNSNFSFQLTSQVVNNGQQDMTIYARRLENHLPNGWSSSMCIDVCYSASVDSTLFLLPAGGTQAVSVYFYTSAGADTGHVKMGLRNLNNPANDTLFHAFAITE